MKKYFFKGSAVLILGGLIVSCTHDDFDYSSIVENKKAEYQKVFVDTYGPIDPNHTWGFGSTSATKGVTRAAGTWTLDHNDDWMSYLEFTTPTDYIEVKEGTTLSGSNTYYVPATYTGTLNFADNFGGKIYIAGTLTGYTGNNMGTVSVYIFEKGSWTLESITTGTITIYNNGTLTLGSGAWQNQNIKTVYNGGNIKIGKEGEYPNFADGVSLYSNSTGLVEIYGVNTDLKLTCDVHGKMKVYGDLKIQNGRTQYICGLEVSGTLDMTQGKLETSYVEATDIKFDGAHIWLLPQGHIVAKNQISMPNSASEIYGHAGSYALVETKNFYLRNHNNFAETFSSNISFKVTGTIDIQERITQSNGQVDDVSNQYTVAEYVVSQNGKAVADRFNGDEVSGSPACGAPYGNTDITIPTDQGETTDDSIKVVTKKTTYETIELFKAGRVFCEDLGQISSSDLDFNDVVFDAYIYKVTPSTQTIVEEENGEEISNETVTGTSTYKTVIVLLAAGGTLELTVANINVHNRLGNNDNSTIINTITSKDDRGSVNHWVFADPEVILLGAEHQYENISEIPIWVNYGNNSVLKLEAEPGLAPHKICVPIGTKWCKEREKMEEAYQDFGKWVNDAKNVFWEGSAIINKSFLYPSDGLTYQLPVEVTEGKHQLGEPVVTISYRPSGGGTTGGYQGETVLSRQFR